MRPTPPPLLLPDQVLSCSLHKSKQKLDVQVFVQEVCAHAYLCVPEGPL